MHRPLVDKHMPPLISAIGGPGFSRRISQCSTSSNCSGINSPLYEGAELRDMSDGNRPNISAIEIDVDKPLFQYQKGKFWKTNGHNNPMF